MTKHLKQIRTTDSEGYWNGAVLPVWNSAYDNYRPEQVYVTTILPGGVKGPHLHLKRAGAFCAIKGEVLIVTRRSGEYQEAACGERNGYKLVHVEPGVPCALYNIGDCESFVLNLPSPPWKADDQDEHPVEGWEYTISK
jgi:dTDP-4-dehydrorhamnose 3,5-epimerase